MARWIWVGTLMIGCGYRMPAPASSPSARPPRPRMLEPTAYPPISGGTLVVTRDNRRAVVADPDRDRIWVVELTPPRVTHQIALHEGDEPGRLVEDGAGRVHVALRSGSLVSLDPVAGDLLARRAVCPAPRGVAYDASEDTLHVACAGGELVELPANGAEPRTVRRLDADLRDVLVSPDGLLVSRFRSAELVRVHEDTHETIGIPDLEMAAPFGRSSDVTRGPYAAAVAWRTIPAPDGGSWMVHQREWKLELGTARGVSYGGAGGSIVRAALTYFVDGELERSFALGGGALPVDVAVDETGEHLAVVFAGSDDVRFFDHRRMPPAGFENVLEDSAAPGTSAVGAAIAASFSQPVAIAWAGPDRVVVQYRDPPALAIYSHGRTYANESFVRLGEALPLHRGHTIFHAATRSSQIACASCHPEGGEDAHTWRLGTVGPRRTQTLRGGVLQGAPFHWDGDLDGMGELVSLVYEERMGGVELSYFEVGALGSWLDAIPNVPPSRPADPEAVARGRALFFELACDSCHAGERLTDDRSHDVGTGARFQTPTLIGLATRAPYLHDGCAATLQDRFEHCHTRGHGDLEGVDADGVSGLVAFLSSL